MTQERPFGASNKPYHWCAATGYQRWKLHYGGVLILKGFQEVAPTPEEPRRADSVSDSRGASGGAASIPAGAIVAAVANAPSPQSAPDPQSERMAEEERQRCLLGDIGLADCAMLGIPLRSSGMEFGRAFRQKSLEAHPDKSLIEVAR